MSFGLEEPTYKAGGTIAPSTFVKPDTGADDSVVAAGAGDDTCGVSQEGMKRTPGLAGSDITVAAESGDPLRVFGVGRRCLLTLGGTVTRGDWLKSDASGFGVTASSNDIAGARALKSGVVNNKIPVLVFSRKV